MKDQIKNLIKDLSKFSIKIPHQLEKENYTQYLFKPTKKGNLSTLTFRVYVVKNKVVGLSNKNTNLIIQDSKELRKSANDARNYAEQIISMAKVNKVNLDYIAFDFSVLNDYSVTLENIESRSTTDKYYCCFESEENLLNNSGILFEVGHKPLPFREYYYVPNL